ncbi:MAG: hypothetical protein FJZ92_11955 [Chloroflexi bacterium]|nr:hypothetical protein [Chloroflexota bacterium]
MQRSAWYVLGIVAGAAALVVGAVIPSVFDSPRAPLVSWFVVMALLTFAFGCLGKGANVRWTGGLIDDRRKVNVSRLQMAAWTILGIGAIFAVGMNNLAIVADHPLDFTVPEELCVLMGISWVRFAGSQLIKTQQVRAHQLTLGASAAEARWIDM